MTNWHALSIPSRTEHRAADALIEHGFPVYVPTEKRWATHAGKKTVSRSAYLPGYLFVEVSSNRGFYELLKTVPRARLVMAGDQPAKIPGGWVTYMQAKEADGFFDRTAVRKPKLAVGDTVEIVEGAGIGRIATIMEIQNPEKRIMVLLQEIGGLGAKPQPIEAKKLMKREREAA